MESLLFGSKVARILFPRSVFVSAFKLGRVTVAFAFSSLTGTAIAILLNGIEFDALQFGVPVSEVRTCTGRRVEGVLIKGSISESNSSKDWAAAVCWELSLSFSNNVCKTLLLGLEDIEPLSSSECSLTLLLPLSVRLARFSLP